METTTIMHYQFKNNVENVNLKTGLGSYLQFENVDP